jgi:fructose-6-phosphate aldolase 2
MQYLLDTANVEQIRKAYDSYPIDGVTTNPTIISKEDTDYATLLRQIREIIGKDGMFHVQTTQIETEGIINEAIALRDYINGNFYIKIPVIEAGIKAIKILKKMGFQVTATAIFTQQQALIAARAGADYVAPYVNRLDNIASDGVGVVEDFAKLFKVYDFKTKVLAASFKNVEQVHKISLVGAHAVTVQPELLNSMIYHPLTDAAIIDFARDWRRRYERKYVLDLLKGQPPIE